MKSEVETVSTPLAETVELLRSKEFREAYDKAPPIQRLAFDWRLKWLSAAHKHQILPSGDWWSIWLLLAGRGAGKTRVAAEQIGWWAWTTPNSRWLVSAPTSADVRSTCFEGDSGLLNVIPAALIKDYNKSYHEIKLINGSLIKGVPSSEPERFRGGQYHGAWCLVAGTQITMADHSTKNVEDVVVGDYVLTRHGARKVLVSGLSNNPNDVVTIDCGNTSLTLTVDHPILVGNQWVEAGNIKQSDKLCHITSRLRESMFTAQCMSSTTGQYQRGGSFITKITTSTITALRTWRRCLVQRIKHCMQKVRLHPIYKSVGLLKRLSRYVYQRMQRVFNAMECLSPNRQAPWASFVLDLALRSGVSISSYKRQENATYAATNISLSSASNGTVPSDVMPNQLYGRIALKQTEVLSVARLPNMVTYNLTVEGEHEYIANGIVVHNCDELAAWEYLRDAWDMIMFSVRLGKQTRILATTTPKPKELIMELIERDGDNVVVTTASTYDNIDNLAPSFREQILSYEGTKIGRQEIYAEIIDPEEGGIINRDWFRLWPSEREFPQFEYVLQSYDTAFTERTTGDPTACSVWGIFKPLDRPLCAMLIDCWSEHLAYPDLKPKLLDDYTAVYGEPGKRVDLVLIEEKASGQSLIQDLARAHVQVRGYNPGRLDKVQRVHLISNIIAAGRVYLPESTKKKGYVRDWAEPFVQQVCSFPETQHDDYCDTMSQALRYLRDAGFLEIDPAPHYEDSDYADETRIKRVNPYAE